MQMDGIVKLTAVDIWNPTMMLRWNIIDTDKKVLQQKWVSNFGKEEWRNIPEEDKKK